MKSKGSNDCDGFALAFATTLLRMLGGCLYNCAMLRGGQYTLSYSVRVGDSFTRGGEIIC